MPGECCSPGLESLLPVWPTPRLVLRDSVQNSRVNASAVFTARPLKRPLLLHLTGRLPEVHEKMFHDLYARNIFASFEYDGVFFFLLCKVSYLVPGKLRDKFVTHFL